MVRGPDTQDIDQNSRAHEYKLSRHTSHRRPWRPSRSASTQGLKFLRKSETAENIWVSLVKTALLWDVANSLEFSSRVAIREVGDDNQHTSEYWIAFTRSILQIGWFRQADQWSSDFIDGRTTGAENFSDYVIENVRSDPLYSNAEKELVIRALESLRSQAEKRAFFRRFTAGGSKGSYGVNAAAVTNGALAMRFSAFAFNCSAVVEDYLIFSIKNITADVQKNNVEVAANQRTIDSVRNQIEARLDEAAGDFIDNVDI